jgi:hypothetical protein
MRPLEDAFLLEPFQVTADGGFRGFEQGTQIGCARDLMAGEILLDTLASLRRDQRFGHRTEGSYFIVEGK